MAIISTPLSEQESAARLEDYRQAIATLRLEGLQPGDEARAIFQRYVDGELTLTEMGAEIDKLHERQFGRPVPLSGNADS